MKSVKNYLPFIIETWIIRADWHAHDHFILHFNLELKNLEYFTWTSDNVGMLLLIDLWYK